ncbi:MAG TPA: hypothetical protein VHT05_13835 [Candidatus Elarobacter sp.]|nr:hypothetical protein [Candidatus Elarobacter sp.]
MLLPTAPAREVFTVRPPEEPLAVGIGELIFAVAMLAEAVAAASLLAPDGKHFLADGIEIAWLGRVVSEITIVVPPLRRWRERLTELPSPPLVRTVLAGFQFVAMQVYFVWTVLSHREPNVWAFLGVIFAIMFVARKVAKPIAGLLQRRFGNESAS